MFNEIIKYSLKSSSLSVQTAHMHQHPEMNEIMYEIFEKFLDKQENYPETTIKMEINMGRVVGHTTCVQTNDKDEIFYAQRRGRKTLSRFVKGVAPIDCDTVTVVIARSRNPAKPNCYKLITAYIGYADEKEPLDPSIKTEADFLKAKTFWQTHAMTQGSQRIYKETITTQCPWDSFHNRAEIKLGIEHSSP